jgi:hypothetical protein
MVNHDPDAQWMIPKTKPVSDEKKEADSGSNFDGRAEAPTVGVSEAGGIAILVAVTDFVLDLENAKVNAIGAATRTVKPAETDQIIILLRLVMGSLPPSLKITAGQME